MALDDVTAVAAVPGPVQLTPFAATRLAATRVGDPASARLLARPHRAVAERIQRWRRLGNLVQDTSAGIYVHEYSTQGLTVRGLVALADLRPNRGDCSEALDQHGAIRPHEDVDAAQVRDLTARMRAMRVNPAPLLLLHRGTSASQALVEQVVGQQPLAKYVDRAGQRHHFWKATDQGLTTELAAAYAEQNLVVADGHHRLAAYQALQRQTEDPAWDQGLVMAVDHATTPLYLAAIHRVVRGATLAEVAKAAEASGAGQVRRLEPGTYLHALDPHTLVITDGDDGWAVTVDHDPDTLAVEVLHRQILPALPMAPQVEYHHSVEAAMSRVSSPARDEPRVVALLPALRYDALVNVVQAGRRLPEKATSFQPKPSPGSIMRSLDALT